MNHNQIFFVKNMKNLNMDIINMRKKPECSVCGATLRFDYGVQVACGTRNAIRFQGFLVGMFYREILMEM